MDYDFDWDYNILESHHFFEWWGKSRQQPSTYDLDSRQLSQLWEPDPLFRYHREFGGELHGTPRSRLQPKSRMANVVPWLVTMSLLGFQDFVEPVGHISQELLAPPLPQLVSGPIDFVTTSTSSFDDPAFGPEEPPNHANCDQLPSNHNFDNTVGQRQRPHGFQVEAKQANVAPKKDRLLDVFQNGANSNNIVQTSQPGLDESQANQSEKFFQPGHTFKPPKDTGYKDEYAGPAMQLAYHWKTIDYEFESEEERNSLIYGGTFIPENNLPLGLEIWRDKIFVSLPRWKKGIPATLATIPAKSSEQSPKLRPYPDWRWHHLGNCQGLTSVFRMQVDECDRLWVLDSGKIDVTSEPQQICPPGIFIFDLRTDELVRAYQLPADQIKEDSLYANIVVDARPGQCEHAVAYAADVWRFGLLVYDLHNDSSFRLQHHFFFPEPLNSRFSLHGLEFHWTDGLFGLALTPLDVHQEKTLFFHPMASFREFAVPLSALRDRRTADGSSHRFVPVGRPRAKDYGHASGSAIDRRGVMFFNMVTRDSVWCWDTRKEYVPQNLGVVGSSNVSLVFPNDVRVDHEEDQSVWVLSNRLPMYLYGHLVKDEVNFRILRADVREAVRGTVCDPSYVVPESAPSFDLAC